MGIFRFEGGPGLGDQFRAVVEKYVDQLGQKTFGAIVDIAKATEQREIDRSRVELRLQRLLMKSIRIPQREKAVDGRLQISGFTGLLT